MRRVGVGGEALLRSRGAFDALKFHEPGHLVTTAVKAATPRGLGELASPVDAVVLPPEVFEDHAELFVTQSARRGRAGLLVVVGAGGNL